MEKKLTPPEKDKWALITTYKVLEPADINFQFMETYINFYRKKWNVTKEILLVGVPEELIKKDYLTQIAARIAGPLVADLSNIDKANFSVSTQFNVQTNIPIDPFFRDIHYHSSPKTDVIFYTTNYSTSNEEWDIIKNTLYNICNQELDPSYNRVINIDNDEFLFLDSERPPQVEEWFHFLNMLLTPREHLLIVNKIFCGAHSRGIVGASDSPSLRKKQSHITVAKNINLQEKIWS